MTQVLLTELDRHIRRPAVKEVIHDRLQRRGRHRWKHIVAQPRQRNRVARRLGGQQRGRRSVARDRRVDCDWRDVGGRRLALPHGDVCAQLGVRRVQQKLRGHVRDAVPVELSVWPVRVAAQVLYCAASCSTTSRLPWLSRSADEDFDMSWKVAWVRGPALLSALAT